MSHAAELQLTAAGDFEVSTAGGVTQFTLDDPTQSVVTTQDGVMSYLIQGTEVRIANTSTLSLKSITDSQI